MGTTDQDTAEDIQDMQNNETPNSSEKLLVLPLGKESKKITQVITNDTARQIIEQLAETSMSASNIAARLNVPLTTIKYNLENLIDAGLIKIERIKYSEKGREVKVYAPVRKLIVVVPEKMESTAIMDILKKYIGVIVAAVCASGLIELLTKHYGMVRNNLMEENEELFSNIPPDEFIPILYEDTMDSASNAMNDTVNVTTTEALEEAATHLPETVEKGTQMPTSQFIESAHMESVREAVEPGLSSHPGLWFLFGCLFIITLIIIIDYYRQKK